MGKAKQPTRLYSIIFKRVFVVSLLAIVLGMAAAGLSVAQRFLDEIGASRLDILRQIASLNQVVKSVSTSVADDVYASLRESYRTHGESELFLSEAKSSLVRAQSTFDRYHMDASIDLVFGEGDIRLSSSQSQREPLLQLLRSYWYINLTAGRADRSWNMRFLESEDSGSAVLSYGRVLRDADESAVCTVIVNASQNMVFKTYSDKLRQDNRMYIIDEDGIIVSHSNPALVGFALYHMAGAQEAIRPGTFTLQRQRTGTALVTSHYDPATGWTIVEELQVSAVLGAYRDAFLLALLILLLSLAFALLISYITARTITKPLLLLSRRMQQFCSDNPEPMPVQNQYYEVQVLSQTFNTMTGRIRRLIADIKHEEAEKRSIEFDFLQAQINPHFLHNTLMSIKSLLLLGRQAQAADMLDAFIGLLKMPVRADRKEHALHEEIEYTRRYITIMEHRYGRPFPLSVFVESGLESLCVPQLILQPLVENAIFHGLSEKEADSALTIAAVRTGAGVQLEVQDNGDGNDPSAN